ncbi:MAG TPA: glycosyltransferase [Tepidisphaeraceae bacterium]|jgi:glycosyltransferase involved in cell wall biosynthesis
MSDKVRVVHIINSFEFGGAESMLCNLLLRSDRRRFDPHVVALIDDLRVAGPIVAAEIPLVTMGMKPGLPSPLAIVRLIRHLRRLRPAVVQTWMDHSNLIGGVAARFVPGARVVWGIHHSNHVAELTKRTTLMTVGACARLSGRVPARIVCCSEQSRVHYGQRGFTSERLTVIPNGFDTDHFRPDATARLAIRQEIGVAPDAPLVGLVARYDPVKDHATFLRAAAIVHREFPDAQFLMCGDKVDPSNAALTQLIDSLGIGRACHLLGPRRDVARIYAALDISTSSSISEAFPLAVGEAMACGVPCVATDVGDSALMVGDTGMIVPPGDPGALAAGMAELIGMAPSGRARLGGEARRRVRDRFDLGTVTRRYEALYEEILGAESNPDRAPERVEDTAEVMIGAGS